MTLEAIPWMIKGGIHSENSGRRVLYKATNGSEGVSGIGDLAVKQTAVASSTIQVMPGGATMLSRYPGVKGESYDGQVTAAESLVVPANSTGSVRYDMVIARIDDWNMPGGQAVPATLPTSTVPAFKLQIITNVNSSYRKASQLGLNYPAIALARITMPANTTTVAQSQILNLREMTMPRRQRALLTKSLVPGQEETLNSTTTQTFPAAAIWITECPEWASRARVSARWNGVLYPPGSSYGTSFAKIGTNDPAVVATQEVAWDTPNAAGNMRTNWEAADDVAIPAGLRGKSIDVRLIGKLTSGLSAARPQVTAYSSVVLDIEWLEAPAEDA